MPQLLSVIVDDDPVLRSYVSAILQREHFETLEATNGVHGMGVVRNLGGDVDLIVTDIQMPGGDGLSFARSVKEYFTAVPIILVSGYEKPDADFDFKFVQKPFTPKALLGAVHNVMATSGSSKV